MSIELERKNIAVYLEVLLLLVIEVIPFLLPVLVVGLDMSGLVLIPTFTGIIGLLWCTLFMVR